MRAVLALACAAFGALAGACVPRVAYRLSVEFGSPSRSGCADCRAPFPEGLPGWVRAGDRCPRCGARLGAPAWLTAPTGAVACGVLGWLLAPTTVADALVLAAFLLVSIAGVGLAAIDLACLRLPDVIVGPAFGGALLLLGAAAALTGAGGGLLRAVAASAALVGGYLVLALVPGANLGFGDVKLCAPLGLLLGWLGWGAVLLGAVLPHLINGPVALALLLAGRAGRRTALPLGPALLAGALLAVVVHAVWTG
jgi:leader peptidase (prepilin peptidase) / N-methyltransferase